MILSSLHFKSLYRYIICVHFIIIIIIIDTDEYYVYYMYIYVYNAYIYIYINKKNIIIVLHIVFGLKIASGRSFDK